MRTKKEKKAKKTKMKMAAVAMATMMTTTKKKKKKKNNNKNNNKIINDRNVIFCNRAGTSFVHCSCIYFLVWQKKSQRNPVLYQT